MQSILLSQLDHLKSYVGNTPLMPLVNAYDKPGVQIHLKLEWQQLGGSVKTRAAFNMIYEAVKSGSLTPDKSILDSTSGNTGISYAVIAARLGLPCTIIMPENVTEERKTILKALGAEIIFVSKDLTGDEVHQFAKDTYAANPEKYFYANQYDNPHNWQAHYHTTAKEIFKQTAGKVTHFAAALGTTGTFTGTGRRLKELSPEIKVIGLNVEEQDNEIEGWKHLATSKHPEIYDGSIADQHLHITTAEAFVWVKKLARQEGLLVSPSSAAAVAGAVRLADQIDSGIIVTVLPDDANKYGEIIQRIF
jgi:cysteine synthase B